MEPSTREQVVVLEGHTLEVLTVCISRDNKYIVSGSEDMTVRVWNLQRAVEEAIIQEHNSKVIGITITGDNKYIVFCTQDNTIRIWSFKDKNNIAILRRDSPFLTACIVATSDDQYILSGSLDTVRIWNIPEEVALAGDKGWVNGIARMFATKYIREIDTSSGLRVRTIAITSDNEYIVTGSGDYPIKIWSFKDLKEIGALEGHTHPVVRVGITSDKNYIITVDAEKIVRIWSLQYKKHEAVFKDSEEASMWNSKYPEISQFFN